MTSRDLEVRHLAGQIVGSALHALIVLSNACARRKIYRKGGGWGGLA